MRSFIHSRFDEWRLIGVAFGAMLMGASIASGQSLFDLSRKDAPPAAEELVKVSLMAEAQRVTPGETFLLGVHFAIEPKWHLYWKNSGDTGAPPTITLDLPEGVESGEILWPAPLRYEHSGGLVDAIHEEELTLLIPIVTTGDLSDADELHIGATVDWLVCRELCLLGAGELTLTLPVSARPDTENAAPEVAEAFASARARLPRPLTSSDDVALSWSDDSLLINAEGADELTFFHESPAATGPSSPVTDTHARGDSLHIAYPVGLRKHDLLRGVLEIRRGGNVEHLSIETPTPQSR